MVRAIELGYPQSEIHRAALADQKEVESKERIIVGINAHSESDEPPVRFLRIKGEVERRQIKSLRERKRRRSVKKLALALGHLARVAQEGGYLMPPVLDAVRCEATVGEICDVFRQVYGEYRETVNI
jgi:methylmalonyl-CoA mutase N-terminal domain/subunit